MATKLKKLNQAKVRRRIMKIVITCCTRKVKTLKSLLYNRKKYRVFFVNKKIKSNKKKSKYVSHLGGIEIENKTECFLTACNRSSLQTWG